jgi:hypothetical protein
MAEKPSKKAPKKAPRKRKPKNTDKEKHYVNSKEFLEELSQYYETDEVTDILAGMITKIANGLSYAPNFINYSYKGNNPFSYYTTIAFHAFINRIKKEKKYHETVTSYQETVYADLVNSNPGVNIYTKSPDSDGNNQQLDD